MTTTILISGANRGIGLGLAEAYALRPDYTVILAVRSPGSVPSIRTADSSRLVIIKVDASSADHAREGIEELKTKYGVNKLDLVIANAAIMEESVVTARVDSVSPEAFEKHWRVNVLGSLLLFQATVPLIPEGGKFIFMSSGASIIDRIPDKSDMAYGITKSSMNYLARYAHFEHPELVIFSLSPGWVQTEMGNLGARVSGREKAPITVEESVSGMTRVIDSASREKVSGLHMRYGDDSGIMLPLGNTLGQPGL
ncbi:MAG: hypothetical protein TREMPRED_003670 [Tremellales sp. Tagirdzhanova-0007]|nr:MAG: hypothetical protein TREMPRED_003670 [Tremellales sp. Tagirdzhanova-0007]